MQYDVLQDCQRPAAARGGSGVQWCAQRHACAGVHPLFACLVANPCQRFCRVYAALCSDACFDSICDLLLACACTASSRMYERIRHVHRPTLANNTHWLHLLCVRTGCHAKLPVFVVGSVPLPCCSLASIQRANRVGTILAYVACMHCTRCLAMKQVKWQPCVRAPLQCIRRTSCSGPCTPWLCTGICEFKSAGLG